jgi:uncharacterized protein (TIGR03790 family)
MTHLFTFRLFLRIDCFTARSSVAGCLLLILSSAGAVPAQERPPVAPSHVLVVENTDSPDSRAIGDYYMQKRKVPPGNLCQITCPTTEECGAQDYQEKIQAPVKSFLAKNRLEVDFIVLTKGIPIRIRDGELSGFSTDSVLTMMDWTLLKSRTQNPYFARHERFSHKKFNLYLVTRLDGYTRDDCLRLVDNALAAKPLAGPFLLHTGPGHEDGGYKPVNDGMRHAQELLTNKALKSILSTSETFAGGYKDLMGYFSWGSNDGKYDKKAYNSLRFAPGAVAETAVSTSGRTFSDPNAPGQSLIADLIAQGVTGCKGYVSEPYADSIAHADILFDRYTAGFALAESFYMASYWVFWRDVVIGDPLCAPYASPKTVDAKGK